MVNAFSLHWEQNKKFSMKLDQSWLHSLGGERHTTPLLKPIKTHRAVTKKD